MKNITFKIKDKEYNVEIVGVEDTMAKVNVNGISYEVEVNQPIKTTKTPTLVRPIAVPSTDSTPTTARTASPSAPKGTGTLKSPLPGKILDIYVKLGENVKVGQTLICLEAMKMENNINSDREGVITSINVHKNDTVLEGDVLVEIG